MGKVFYKSKLAEKILWDGYSTIMLFGFIFTKKDSLKPSSLRHEKIHCEQYKECLELMILPFLVLIAFNSFWWIILYPLMYYIIYGTECLISYLFNILKDILKGKSINMKEINSIAYKASAFEMEACDNEGTIGYLEARPKYSFFKYYGKI